MKPRITGIFSKIILLAALVILLTPTIHTAASSSPLFDLTLALDGVDDYAMAPDSASLDLGTGTYDDFTIELFYYIPDSVPQGIATLAYKNGAYGLFINFHEATPDVLAFRMWTDATNYVTTYAMLDFSSGWHHIAVAFDNEWAASQDQVALYLDGNLLGTAIGTDYNPGARNTSNPLYVGGYQTLNFASGWIEEMRFSSSVKYSGSTYTVPSAPFSPAADTRALWHFDEDWGSDIFIDSSGHGNVLVGTYGAQIGNPTGAMHKPGSFEKSGPANLSTQPTSLTLSWTASPNALDGYEYCLNSIPDNSCLNSWVSVPGTSVILSGLLNSKTYSWQVRARNRTGTTDADGGGLWWRFTTLPPAPGSLNKHLPADGATDWPTAVLISWGSTPGASSYEYCFDQSDDDDCDEAWTDVGNTTSANLGTLDYSTTYYWQVRAVNTGGSTEANGGNWWSFTTVPYPPAWFSKGSPTTDAFDQPQIVHLEWQSSTHADHYEYCYDESDDSDCSGAWTSTGANTNADVDLGSAASGKLYYWQVRAVNPGGTTYADGNQYWHFSVASLVPLGFSKTAPAGGASGQPTSLTLSWGTSTDATGYEYCYDDSPNSQCNTSWHSVGNVTHADISGLLISKPYSWQVRATNDSGATEANGGTWWTFTTVPAAPAAFHKLTPANGVADMDILVQFTWEASSPSSNFEICIDMVDNNSCDTEWTILGEITSYLPWENPGTTYYWQVRAETAGGTTEADGGDWWSFTTIPQSPAAFNKLTPAYNASGVGTSVRLSWETSSRAASYWYCIQSGYHPLCQGTWISTGTATHVDLSGLALNTTYSWQVKAHNAGGDTYTNLNGTFRFSTAGLLLPFSKTEPADNLTGVSTSPTIRWQTQDGASGYETCYDKIDDDYCGGTWTPAGSTNEVGLTNLENNTTYYWQVRAVNAVDTEYADGGAWWSFTTQSLIPGSFHKIAPINDASHVGIPVSLSWETSSGATEYYYCIQPGNYTSCSGTWVSVGAQTSVELSYLSTNAVYTWQVYAVNDQGTTFADGGLVFHFNSSTGPNLLFKVFLPLVTR